MLGIALLVVVTVLAGGWAVTQLLAPAGSQITLVVDGTRIEMRTELASVGALLEAEHITLGPGDVVQPSAGSSLHDGLHVDVLRSFPVTVDIDGTVRTVRTVETSTAGLAEQLDLGKLTAVRNQPGRLGAGATVVYRTRISGSLKVDDQTVTFDSPSRTVDELLQSYSVDAQRRRLRRARAGHRARRRRDRRRWCTSAPRSRRTTRRSRSRPWSRPTPTFAIGETRVLQHGTDGTMVVTYRQRLENGEKGERSVISEVPSVAPMPRIIGYGTLRQSALGRAAMCESGGRWDTVDSAPNGFDGGLGIARSTWRAWGGTEFAPNAGLATREQQIIVGMRIYADLGWDPWGCANNVLNWPQWSM